MEDVFLGVNPTTTSATDTNIVDEKPKNASPILVVSVFLLAVLYVLPAFFIKKNK